MSHKPDLIVSSRSRGDDTVRTFHQFRQSGHLETDNAAAIAKGVTWCLEQGAAFTLTSADGVTFKLKRGL